VCTGAVAAARRPHPEGAVPNQWAVRLRRAEPRAPAARKTLEREAPAAQEEPPRLVVLAACLVMAGNRQQAAASLQGVPKLAAARRQLVEVQRPAVRLAHQLVETFKSVEV